MKIFTFYRYLIITCLLLIVSLWSYGQRNYATSQQSGSSGTCLVCSVDNAARAADGNIESFSTLNVSLGAFAQTYQELIFPAASNLAAGTPVTIKLGTGNNLLDATVLGGILLQAYNGTTAIGQPVAAGTLVSAASGNNQSEVTFTPTQAYDRVRVTLDAGLLGAASSIYLYEAFYNGPGPVPCDAAIDELHGISSALLNLGLSVGGVQNPEQAIDGNINTASTLNAGVAAAGSYAQQTVIYQSPSVVGDSLRLTLGIPQALIDAGVLSNITISTFNGDVNNNDAQALNSPLANAQLLGININDGTRQIVATFVPPKVFDRVQLRLGGGIANVLTTLNFYEAQKIIPSPVISFNNMVTSQVQLCSGSSATLVATPIPNTVINWYTQPTGGTAVFTGNTFTTPQLTATTTYYAEAMRNGCTDASARTKVTVTVNDLPSAPVITNNSATICQGLTATFTAQTVSGISVKWYAQATGGTPLYTGDTFTTPVLNANASFYAEAVNASSCPSAQRTQVNVTVNPAPNVPALSSTAITIKTGQTATISVTNAQPGVIYNWYTQPTGGAAVYTGITYTTPPLTATTTYYVEGAGGNGCTSTSRAQVTVTVNTIPDIAVNPPTQAVNAGQTATFTASSSTPNATFNWYAAPSGGTPIFTGPTFTTPAINNNTTYYADATNPTTGVTSSTRATGTVTVNNGNGGNRPDITVTPPTQTVNPGQTATFTASSTTPGETFNWYTTPTGGAPIYTGPVFTTPPVNGNTTYYAEAKDPTTGATSPTRATGTVNVNGGSGSNGPDVAVTPPNQAVNAGQTATFTASSSTPNAAFNWYTTPSGGAPVFTGPTYTTPPVNANTTYYAEATNPSTGATSPTRATGTVTVNNGGGGGGTPPDIAVTPPSQAVNPGQTATFTASSNTPGETFNWYTTPTGGTPIYTGPVFTTPPVNGDVTYYAEAKDPSTGVTSTTRATGTVSVNPAPDIVVTPPTQGVNTGQTATFTASSTTPNSIFKWYTTSTGGSPVFTGSTYTTPPVTANATYYAEAVNPSTGATSPTRATGAVTINPAPDVAVTPPTRAVNTGQTTTFTASSTTPNATFKWYTTPTGGTAVFTGPAFTTPAINNNVTYYAEAANPSTGAISTIRATGTVTVNPAPDIAVTPATQTINNGLSATLNASSTTPNTTFNWYTTPTGGTPIYTGPTFITPPVTANVTYYAEAKNPVTGAVSLTRAMGTIAVNGSSANDIFVPNAFTPNNDGKNDVLMIYGTDIKSVKFSVYDQWGELQFQSTSQSSGWDGTYKGRAQPVGVYVYYLEAVMNDNNQFKKKGTITLLR